MSLPYLLTTLIALPIVSGLLLILFGSDKSPGFARTTAMSAAVLNMLLSLFLLGGGSFQEKAAWLPSLGINYFVRVDGLSLFLILLVTFLTPAAIVASWKLVQERTKLYYGCMLLLSGGMVGVLAAMDLFVFYVFWEVMLIPAFFLVGVFGGANRRPATTKFVIYTMVGSLLMLVGLVFVAYTHYAATGTWSFNLLDLYGQSYGLAAGRWAFAAFALAFGIKAALFPLHTWLPDTYAEAPAPVTFMLSAVMSKLGIYGFLRLAMPLFPEAAHYFTPLLIALAVAGVIYAALIALVQDDAKRVIAYASVSHLGVILLGVFTVSTQALTGAVFHMVAHALTTGALFLLLGFLYERKGTTSIKAFGGLTAVMPVFATVMMVVTLASVGLPGLNGFIGEFMIFLGAFGSHATPATVATLSIIVGAAYMLWLYQRLLFGPVSDPANRAMPDMTMREGLLFVPFVALIIGLGVAPQPLLAKIQPAVSQYQTLMHAPKAASVPTHALEALAESVPASQAETKEGTH